MPRPSTAASKPPRAAKSASKARAPARKAAPLAKKAAGASAPTTARVIAMPGAPVRRRSNRRSEKSIENILACTEQIVLESGAARISILDVCRAAGVARGTFYRYFASQEELLDAFARHKRESFHKALVEKVAGIDDPGARFAAVIDYLDNYLQHSNARRLLTVAPEYALGFFKRIFQDSLVRFQDVLGIVFDAWEARLGVTFDRELIVEMLIRYVLSELLVPSTGDRKTLPRRIGRMVDSLVMGGPVRARR